MELAARILSDIQTGADMIVFGDRRALDLGAQQAGVVLDFATADLNALSRLTEGSVLIDLGNCDPDDATVGVATSRAGAAALENFRAALLTAKVGLVDAVAFTPFNKAAMRMAKTDYIDEIGFIDAVLDAPRSGREFNVLDEVWNARVTSHVPLRDVAGLLSPDRIFDSLKLTVEVMQDAGIERPRIGVAALNPHAGDGRNFGSEDEDIILPAVERAKAEQMAVKGPVPSDTVFVRALKGEFDAVLTMFHDQGQIAMKLIGFDRGVTLIAGYGFPIVTPAHGTAYDIAGQGVADMGATMAALKLGRRLAARAPQRNADYAARKDLIAALQSCPRYGAQPINVIEGANRS
ncbi:4-hydroxythreonine-4-phosphate dehydrogenase PdxA [Litoreibacter arenae]|uniref:4-hydroxythreonine-4-phosphate dehydrogenase PdxA n=1 Tax=Litoreibacter arenae TaxID=491388 RepID=UPI001FE0AC80|nr:4-hydroxythreonine-4-phosphate dehydrogenase PdxA [Litoreibacter arenae]